MEGIPKQPIIKSAETLRNEEEMRENARIQLSLATALYSLQVGFLSPEDPNYGDKIWDYWTEEEREGGSYSSKFRKIINSDDFKSGKIFGGDKSRITAEDVVGFH